MERLLNMDDAFSKENRQFHVVGQPAIYELPDGITPFDIEMLQLTHMGYDISWDGRREIRVTKKESIEQGG